MLKYIAAPLIGALIGYCTNYIAVKMLFRPRHEKYFFGHKVPLTPGAIPKGKTRLAKSVGDVISNHLVTSEDIEGKALNEETETAVTERIMKMLKSDIDSGFRAISSSEEEYEMITTNLDYAVTLRMADAVKSINFSDIIKVKGGQIIGEQLGGSMLGMFINLEMIDSILGSISDNIGMYVDDHCYNFLAPEVSRSMEKLRGDNIYDMITSNGVSDEELRAKVRELYRQTIKAVIPELIAKMDIASMVSQKIEDMEVEQLEDMVMEVMSKELTTIVNLGALIGFILGLINLIF
ncbi:MAG: DUF445 family protein [Mogibacterium diversum]|jgi:hypothetical protein|uniref:DUF445 family protein n=1 Tax=Mogibacterium diversum TaxID=114527 RepID=A0A930EGD7_9FIRM|nr:DUF445 family protein [Mogibacterium diversum]MBF1352127.1 DUF445 family protein [Mogibacterium diversum]UQF81181.1 MAG: DUF445 family protein [Mogibacterium diversum]